MSFDHKRLRELISLLDVQVKALTSHAVSFEAKQLGVACETIVHEIKDLMDGPLVLPKENALPSEPIAKVLVIDDDSDIHRMLRYLLSRQGFAIVSEADPLHALAELSAIAPQVILLDLMMPQMSGFDVLKRLAEHPLRESFKVIVGSERSYDTDRIEALRLGANDFVAKPYNLQELLLRLRKFV